jgi:hypothetical protein
LLQQQQETSTGIGQVYYNKWNIVMTRLVRLSEEHSFPQGTVDVEHSSILLVIAVHQQQAPEDVC